MSKENNHRSMQAIVPVIPHLGSPHYDDPVVDTSPLRKTCEFIVQEMVMRPKDLSLAWEQHNTVLTLTVTPVPGTSKRQLGPLIGRKGVTVEALRRVLQVISLRYGYCVKVNINDGNCAQENA